MQVSRYSESNLNCAQHLIYHGILKKGYGERPAQWGPPVAKAMSALRRLEDAPWDDAFIRRDAIDIVRLVLDRLIVIRIDELVILSSSAVRDVTAYFGPDFVTVAESTAAAASVASEA